MSRINRKRSVGRPPLGDEVKKRYQVMLEPTVAERLREVGGGNLSAGIALAFIRARLVKPIIPKSRRAAVAQWNRILKTTHAISKAMEDISEEDRERIILAATQPKGGKR